ncbi:hypothetical protein NGA_0701400, partial [Nannochloropsis gaditana CCMP526]|uniref:uncharacterized protein n=1 Tax=Nannochloropsis gaditana (strain CCMP526) TaxID=1093141 RepID=UPI00029F5756
MPRTALWSRTGVCIPLALLVMGVHCFGPLDLQGLEKEEAAATPSRRALRLATPPSQAPPPASMDQGLEGGRAG